MAPTLSTLKGAGGAGGADLPTSTADGVLALVLRHLTAAIPLPHRRRASANANTVPESYGLPNSPPPGIVAAIVLGSVAAFLFALWVIYFCINFGVPGRQVWSDHGSVTNVTTATSVVSASRRRKRSTVRRSRSLSRSRSRSRVTSGTVMTNAGPAAAAAAVIAAENSRRNRSGGRRFLKVKKTRRTQSGSGPDMVEVRKGGVSAGGGRGGRYAYHNPNEDQIIVEEEMTDRSALGGGYEASSIRSRSRSRPPMRMPGDMPPRGIPVTMGPGGGRPGAPLPRSRAAGPGDSRPPRAVPSSVMSSEDYSHSESESEDDEIVVMEENSTPPRSRRGGGGGGRKDRR